jgi:uracil-DNA glycosylase family 4
VRDIDPSISVRITNAVKCFSPENRKPSLGEQEACRPYIVQEILDTKPLVILVLGNEALTSLAGQGGISKKRGTPVDLRASIKAGLLSRDMHNIPKILPTWHPAFVLRDRLHYHELEEDVAACIRYIRQLRGDDMGRAIAWQEWSYPSEIDELVESSPYVSYDIETNALPIWHPDFKIHMLGVSDGKKSYVVRRDSHINFVILKLREAVAAGRTQLVGYNSISFDDVAAGLQSLDCMYLDFICDEGISSYQGRAQKGRHKLQSSVIRNLQIAPWKDDVTWDWAQFDPFGPNWENAALYNGRDAVYTHRNFTTLEKKLTEKQQLLIKHIMQPAGRYLSKLEKRGVPISLKNLQEVKLEVEVAKEKALDILARKAFEYELWTFNPNSTPQISELLFKHMGMKPQGYTASGGASTDEETIRSLILAYGDDASAAKTLSALLDYRKQNKLLSTYIEKCVPASDGRIHTSYSLTNTVTGRTASFGWSPQRTPRDKRLRRIITAPPGLKLVSYDLSQIEMRGMAFLSREPNMLAIYKEGKFGGDMHNFMAQKIAEQRGVSEWTAKDRQIAKPFDFACLYGAEWYTVQNYLLAVYGIRLTRKQTIYLRDDVFFGTAFPTLPAYYDKVIAQCRKDGFVEGTFGLRRQLPNINARESLQEAAAREAINTDNQGLSSYLGLIGCFLLEQQATWIEQFAFVHDAGLALVPEEAVEESKAVIQEVFETQVHSYVLTHFGIDFDVPIKIDIKVGQSWGDA